MTSCNPISISFVMLSFVSIAFIIEFSAAEYTASEADGNAVILICSTGRIVLGELSVRLSFRDINATGKTGFLSL